MEPIAFLHSCFKTKFGTPRQPQVVPAATGIVKLCPFPHLQGAFCGLEQFSHVWLIFEFHLNTNKQVRAKVRPPRLGGATMGLFATRSPHRPNNLGLSVVRLERVEHDRLYVSGVDLVDGTPILDIKPYVAECDAIADARQGWVDQAEQVALQVEFSEETHHHLAAAEQRHPHFRELVEQTLRPDPRPRVYRDDDEEMPKYEDIHAVYLYDFDVHFQVKQGVARVIQIIDLGPGGPETLRG